jgi:hypothetical protein
VPEPQEARTPLPSTRRRGMLMGMDENPYKSPETKPGRMNDAHFSPFMRFLVGCGLLAPACWLLGRGLIPPDDVALRFSLVAWLVLTTTWGVFVFRKGTVPQQPSATEDEPLPDPDSHDNTAGGFRLKGGGR